MVFILFFMSKIFCIKIYFIKNQYTNLPSNLKFLLLFLRCNCLRSCLLVEDCFESLMNLMQATYLIHKLIPTKHKE